MKDPDVDFYSYWYLMEDLVVLEELNQKAWSLRTSDAAQGLALALRVQASLARVDWDEMQPVEQAALVESLRNQAFCYKNLGQYGESLAVGLRGLELAQLAGSFYFMAAFNCLLGSVYSRLGDLTSSINSNLKGLAIVQNHPNQELESMLKNCLGRVYYSMGNLPEAYKYSMASLELAPQDDLIIRANALNNIAFILHQMGQNEQALEYSLQSVDEFGRGNHLIGKSEALDTLGVICLALGQAERAMAAHRAGLELARSGQNRGQEVNNLLGIARLQQRSGELQAAMQTLVDTLEITQAMGSKQEEANVHEQLAEICKQQGNYQAALRYFEAFHSISIRLSNEKAERRLQQMQIQYEVESIRKQADQYREQASMDALTGLLNRRRFFELAEQSLHTAQVERRPLGVMMLDIDHFKQINDLHGHPFGDAVLVEVASRLRASLRSDDWAGRYGGDELLVVLHDANCEAAKAIAWRFRQAISAEAVIFEAVRQKITISLGLACYDGGQELSLAELVKQADQALLQAKQSGRNRVVLYEAGG